MTTLTFKTIVLSTKILCIYYLTSTFCCIGAADVWAKALVVNEHIIAMQNENTAKISKSKDILITTKNDKSIKMHR